MGERKLGCWVARKRSDSEPLTFSREEMAVVKYMHGCCTLCDARPLCGKLHLLSAW